MSTATATTTVPTGFDRVSVGCGNGSGSQQNGPVEQVLVYRAALTAAEVASLAFSGEPVDFDDDPRIVYAAETPLTDLPDGVMTALTEAGTGLFRQHRAPILGTLSEDVGPGNDPSAVLALPPGSGLAPGERVAIDGTDEATVRSVFAAPNLRDLVFVS